MLMATVEEEAEVQVWNVTNVVKSGISLVPALRVDLVVEEGPVHLVVAPVRRRLGMYFLLFILFLTHYLLISYSCGGVGHMSRDCVQGSKCYNCNQFVSHFYFIESLLH